MFVGSATEGTFCGDFVKFLPTRVTIFPLCRLFFNNYDLLTMIYITCSSFFKIYEIDSFTNKKRQKISINTAIWRFFACIYKVKSIIALLHFSRSSQKEPCPLFSNAISFEPIILSFNILAWSKGIT